MKIPLIYPKIPDATNCPLKTFYAFNKEDGSLIHFDYNEKDRWHSFGTRRDRFPLTFNGIKEFNEAHPGLEEVADTFLNPPSNPAIPDWIASPLSEALDDFLITQKQPHLSYTYWKDYTNAEITVFTEFVGKNSFAGQHQANDPKKLVLFDVMVNGVLISPEQFLWDFKHFNIPRLVHKGRFTGGFIESVRKNKFKVAEGVVCKGLVDGQVVMCKVKTNEYLRHLKEKFSDKWVNYWE